MRMIYCKEYEFRGMTPKFKKAAWLRYINSGENFYELPSLEAQDELLNSRRNSARSVDVDVNANVATNVGESHVDDIPVNDDEWDFEGAVGLHEVERIDVQRQFRGLQVTCCSDR